MSDQNRSQPLEISVQETAEMLRTDPSARLLDVREPWERAIASIEGSEHLDEPAAMALLEGSDREARLIFMCHHGIRSLSAAAFFAEQGFTRVFSMRGGIHAWTHEIDAAIPTY